MGNSMGGGGTWYPGEKDNVERSREMVSWAKAHGFEIPINEIKDGTHDMSIWIDLPDIFNFFERHQRQSIASPASGIPLYNRGPASFTSFGGA